MNITTEKTTDIKTETGFVFKTYDVYADGDFVDHIDYFGHPHNHYHVLSLGMDFDYLHEAINHIRVSIPN